MVGTGGHQPKGELAICGQEKGARHFWGWEGLQYHGVGLEYACTAMPRVFTVLGCTHTSATYFSPKLNYQTSLHAPTQLLSCFYPAQTQVQK